MRWPETASPIPAALAGDAGFLLGKLAQRGTAALEARLAATDTAGLAGLRVRHVGMLLALGEVDHATQRDLADRLLIDRTTTTATVDDLADRGLVARTPHPTDRRAHAVILTAAGRRALAPLRRVATRANDELLANLDPAERARLVDLLARALG
jgi:DNA-binding MarR family transcriptional regulator